MGQAKNKKQRECPAKGGIITPEDCGRGRNSSIACPADCIHNPFAITNYREQFGALEEKVIGVLSRKLAPELTPSRLREVRGLIESAGEFALHAFQVWEIHGTGRLEKWMADGLHRDWKNDERVLLGLLAHLRPALLEFREVLDEVSVMAVDLLEPGEPFVLIDASTAGTIGRFETCLGWIYPVPAGMRMSGGLAKVPAVAGLEPAEMFRRLLDHLGAPAGERRPWILEHVMLLVEAFDAIRDAQRYGQISGTDHDRDLVPPGFAEGAIPLELEMALSRGDGGSSSEVGLLYSEFADHPNPGLDGKSPREAAADPGLRPRLILQMKRLVTGVDHQRRTRGVDFDLNPLLRELGLDEMILPPPLGFAEEEQYEEDDIPLDPPPPQDLLEGEELAGRLDRVISDEALWNRLDIRLADILDAFNDLSDKLNPNELEALQSTVLCALGALHPDQPPGYEPSPERMLARYETWMRSGDDQESIGEFIDRIFAETRQPALCEAAAEVLMLFEKQSGKKLRPKKFDALFTAIAAAVWEAAHWPLVLE